VAADAGRDDAVAVAGFGDLARRRNVGSGKFRQYALFQSGARFDLHGDERRAISKSAGIVLIARRLVDAHLLAALGCDRHQAHAIGLLHAIAAAFADFFVNDQAQGGLGHGAARTLAALFGGAFLIVDDHRHTGDERHLGQRAHQFVARAEFGVLGQLAERCVLLGVLGEHHGLANALGFELFR
jgi:hypothetical protein